MPKVLTINGSSFEFPESRGNPNWAQDITAWAKAITAAVNTVLTVNDLVVGSQIIDNNSSTSKIITGLVFSPSTIRAAHISYVIDRTYTGNPAGIFETGVIYLVYDTLGTTGNKWFLSRNKTGTAGVNFTISDIGQVSYTSTNITSTGYAGLITYVVKTFNQ
jgi:hypothetical protein